MKNITKNNIILFLIATSALVNTGSVSALDIAPGNTFTITSQAEANQDFNFGSGNGTLRVNSADPITFTHQFLNSSNAYLDVDSHFVISNNQPNFDFAYYTSDTGGNGYLVINNPNVVTSIVNANLGILLNPHGFSPPGKVLFLSRVSYTHPTLSMPADVDFIIGDNSTATTITFNGNITQPQDDIQYHGLKFGNSDSTIVFDNTIGHNPSIRGGGTGWFYL